MYNILYECRAKVFNKILANKFNGTLKELYTMTEWDVVLECKENLTNGTVIII